MKKIYIFFVKSFICVILFLVIAIISKKNSDYRNYIYDKIYNNHFSFSYFNDIYDKYLGGVFPIDSTINNNLESVFEDEFSYTELSEYEDGVKLVVDKFYLVPSMDDGIVIYMGEKEKYGNVVMIENKDGVYVWYGNLCNVSVQLYDNVSKGNYLGESCDDFIYLIYSNGNSYLDYRNYLK